MEKTDFSIREVFQFGWEKTKTNSTVLFQGVLALFGIHVASLIIEKTLHNSIEGFLATTLLMVVSLAVGVGMTIVSLRIARGVPATYKDIVPSADILWRYCLASVLSALAIIGGLILFILPGIYVAIRLMMVRFLILDGSGVRESLQQSFDMTKGAEWKLLGFMVALILINVLGMLALIVGLLVTIPISMMASAQVYLLLKKRG
jgi:uncharacterized membrane protein